MNTLLTDKTRAIDPDVVDTTLLILLIVGVVLLGLLIIAVLYLISSLRRRNVVLKKVDYLIEDITYKSESLNVTVETLNKISNYALTLDAVSQNGIKSAIKLVSENRNYIYSIIEKLRNDVEAREKKATSSTKKKATNTNNKTTPKKTTAKSSTTKKETTKKTTTTKNTTKK